MTVDPQTRDAMSIWKAGVAAVDSHDLVLRNVVVTGDRLRIAGDDISLPPSSRVIVVGAGKAGAGMAAGFEAAVAGTAVETRLTGWVNVPADCVRALRQIHLHGARPAGINEPRAEGVLGTEEILRLVDGAREEDVVVVLLSGGGSALLPAPVAGLSLEDKQELTRFLSRSGATIQELNAVRTHLSRVKGGRLASASRAGRMVTLVISDVIGDPLDVIASGPTWPARSTRAEALAILARFDADRRSVPASVYRVLESLGKTTEQVETAEQNAALGETTPVTHHILGSNLVACEAAAVAARRLGYCVREVTSGHAGDATLEGERLARVLRGLEEEAGFTGKALCVIDGGEPTVRLPTDLSPGKGGRNQQLVLSAAVFLGASTLERSVLLSAGTDGEDGPTDAAGGYLNFDVLRAARSLREVAIDSLRRCDAYPCLDRLGGLWITGPTQTNVMDVRILLAGTPVESADGHRR